MLLLSSYPLGPGGAPCPSDLLVRAECLERVGGFVEEFAGIYQLYEDQAFLAKVYLDGPVFTADSCWTKYRLHDDSCMARVRRAGHRDRVRSYYFRWLRRYIRSAGVRDPRVHAAARDAWRRHVMTWVGRQVRRVTRLAGPRGDRHPRVDARV
jgi:hypothetical protein